MRKEILKLIKEYSKNSPDYDKQRLVIRKIYSEIFGVEKKQIIKYCEQEIKKLQLDFFIRITLLFLLGVLCLILLGILKFQVTMIYQLLLIIFGLYILARTDELYLIMPAIPINFLLAGKIFVYENLIILKEFFLLDSDYDPFGCSSCVYYHGGKYNGNHLICAIHPHGQENCPDFQEPEV